MVPPKSRSSIRLAASLGTTGGTTGGPDGRSGGRSGIACGLFMADFLKVSYCLFDARVAGRRAEVKGLGMTGGERWLQNLQADDCRGGDPAEPYGQDLAVGAGGVGDGLQEIALVMGELSWAGSTLDCLTLAMI